MKYQIELMGLNGIFEASNFGDDRYTVFDTEAEAVFAAEEVIAIFKKSDETTDNDEEISYKYRVVEIE